MSKTVEGQVVLVSEEGNLVTDITAEQLADAPRGEEVSVRCDDHVTSGIFGHDHDQPQMTFVAALNSGGCLELAIVGLNASEMLGIRPGKKVTVKW